MATEQHSRSFVQPFAPPSWQTRSERMERTHRSRQRIEAVSLGYALYVHHDVIQFLALIPKIATIAFIHGPQGSGKTSMVDSLIEQSGRSALIIDCKQLNNAPSDSALVAALATQTGYWPVFNFVNSMGSLIDLASVGLIGQKGVLFVYFRIHDLNHLSSWIE